MSDVSPPAWHVDPVSVDDDRRIGELQERLSDEQGFRVPRTAVIRRAVREMHGRMIGDGRI